MVDNNQNNEPSNELMYIYEWVDSIQLSRPKKNISRDFSDSILLAEIIKHYIPKLVDMNNYPPASSTNQKCYNWTTLNNKVLKKIGVQVSNQEINDIISCKSLSIEHLLQRVYDAIEKTAKIQITKTNNKSETPSKANISKLDIKRKINEKQSGINKLKRIVNELEVKLSNSNAEINSLELQVEQFTRIAKSKGINIE